MLIGTKNNWNHCLNVCFLDQFFLKKNYNLNMSYNVCTLSDLISYSINVQNMRLFH